jgi:hypothetical protein
MYENPVLYVNSVVLAVFHIFAFIIFLIVEKCIGCTQETDISWMGEIVLHYAKFCAYADI